MTICSRKFLIYSGAIKVFNNQLISQLRLMPIARIKTQVRARIAARITRLKQNLAISMVEGYIKVNLMR